MTKIIFFILGTIIGAGLISGKEIQIYFEQTGIIGLTISSIIISIIVYKAINNKIKKQQEKKLKITQEKTKEQQIFEKVILIILILSFFIMVSGMSSLIKQEFKINKIASTTIFAVICMISIKKDIKTILKINEILVIIIIICIIIGLAINIPNNTKNIIKTITNIQKTKIITNISKPIIYASYNLIFILEIIEKIDLKEYKIDKKENKKLSITLALLITALLTSTQILIYTISPQNIKENIPLIYAYKQNKIIYSIYVITIISAIYTTAISILNSILNEIAPRNKSIKKRNKISNIICAMSLITIFYDFTFGVKNIYIIFGIIGLIKINKILIYK